jgi:hypothetical protein
MFHQLGMDLREIENDLFEISTKHEITVTPMREYIEEWLRNKSKSKSMKQISKKKLQQLCHLKHNKHIQKRHQQKSRGFRRISIIVSQVATLLLSLLPFFCTVICHIAFHFLIICETRVDP